MKRNCLSVVLMAFVAVWLILPVSAADARNAAADRLYSLGLFNGVGVNADGSPDYALERGLSRQEAVTMLVRLLGAEQEALAGGYAVPFADVDDWARPYVGYAYANGLTNGLSDTVFGGAQPVTATQYLTFVLRAIGYSSGSQFDWASAWKLTDTLGITDGKYSARNNEDFLRGDAVLVSAGALEAMMADGSGRTLLEVLEERGVTGAGITTRPGSGNSSPQLAAPAEDPYRAFARTLLEEGEFFYACEVSGNYVASDTNKLYQALGQYDVYYASIDGGEEDALRQAVRLYISECMDGNYDDDKDFYPVKYFHPDKGHTCAFLCTDGEGTIIAYGVYASEIGTDCTIYLCDVDSTALAKSAWRTYTDFAQTLTEVSCELSWTGTSLVALFGEIPENAVWVKEMVTKDVRVKDPAADELKLLQEELPDAWISLLRDVRHLQPNAPYYEMAYREDFMESGFTLFQLFVFLDADHNIIAYALGQMYVN